MTRRTIVTLAAVTSLSVLGSGQAAFAHQPVAPSAGDVARSWSVEPGVVLGLVVLAWLYDLGLRRLWARFGRGNVIRPWQAGSFVGAIVVLVVAVVSPLDGLAATLFSAHMVQHMLLMLAAPPLLLLGRIDLALPAALPATWQRRARHFLHRNPARAVVRAVMHPGTVWWLFAVMLWAWHMPEPYQLALRHNSVHSAEHLSMLVVSLAFWQVVLRAAGQRSFAFHFAILFVFTTMLQMSVLCALLTFSGDPWYPHYGATASQWGIGLLTDQRVGALIMWMTSNFTLLGLVALLFTRWFAVEERRADHAIAGL